MSTRTPKNAPDASAVAVDEIDESAFPNIEILENRLKMPEGAPAPAIRLTGQPEPMTLRFINTAIANRFMEATQRHGWLPVKATELADPAELIGLQITTAGLVAQGERGAEILCKMPTRYYQKILRTMEQRHLDGLKSSMKHKERIADALAADERFGDEGAEAARRFVGSVETRQAPMGRQQIADLDEE